jgi:alpha-L-arabinofuranosidase
MRRFIFVMLAAACIVFANSQSYGQIVVKAEKAVSEIQPTMWGLFFEDINFAADGGLYAELIKNRSFEFSKPLMGWKELKQGGAEGSLLAINRGEENKNNQRFLRVKIDSEKGAYGLSNEGFRGMGVKKGNQYNFSILIRVLSGNPKLKIELISGNQEKIGGTELTGFTGKWEKRTASFLSSATDPKASVNILFEGKAEIEIDMVSLFPNDTWKNRPNGLRADLVQLLADIKPGFLRFPGGCIVEGFDLANRYEWKNTVKPIDERELKISRWNYEFKHRLTPDYFQSFGLGFYEYFLLAEDIGAEPLPILNCGMACQFNSAEVVPLDKLDPYIQDMLDLIEFANGDVSTKWGGLRAQLGHPQPFNLKLLGVGNEQWGEQYVDRYKIIAKILKEKHPEIKLVSGPGPSPDGDMFDYLWPELRKANADIVDEHYYKEPKWFQDNATRYDNYDRKGPKVFAGEYAAQSVATCSPENKNNWLCALSEAAFMTGLERNAGVVYMASYAPLFGHSEGWQWTPDLIWFDNLRSYGSANYYVQKLFSNNKGTQVLAMLQQDKPLTGQNGLFASAAIDKKANEIILKVVNVTGKEIAQTVELSGIKKVVPNAVQIVLKSEDLNAVNSLENPNKIVPVEKTLKLNGPKINLVAEPYSLNIIRVKLK